MVERPSDDPLSEVLKAASDPTRRAILTILVQEGPARVTDLAGRFALSLNAVSKHIKTLERAGLVTRRTEWREHLIAPEMGPLRLVDAWFGQLRSSWEMRLDRLAEAITEEDTKHDD
jgi:DNA-binding transcriptional ArsR family regulator